MCCGLLAVALQGSHGVGTLTTNSVKKRNAKPSSPESSQSKLGNLHGILRPMAGSQSSTGNQPCPLSKLEERNQTNPKWLAPSKQTPSQKGPRLLFPEGTALLFGRGAWPCLTASSTRSQLLSPPARAHGPSSEQVAVTMGHMKA